MIKKAIIEAENEATGGVFDDGTPEYSLSLGFDYQKALARLGEGELRITMEMIRRRKIHSKRKKR